MTKKFLAVLILCILSGMATVHAQTGYKFIVDGKEHELRGEDVINEDGQMYIAARRFAEIMGFEVQWYNYSKTLELTGYEMGSYINYGAEGLPVYYGESDEEGMTTGYEVTANGTSILKRSMDRALNEKKFEIKPLVIKDSRSYILLSAFAETMFYNFSFNQANRTFILIYEGTTWQQEYHDMLVYFYQHVQEMNELSHELAEIIYMPDEFLYYSLYDMNNDGIPELFVTRSIYNTDYEKIGATEYYSRYAAGSDFSLYDNSIYIYNKDQKRMQSAGSFSYDVFKAEPEGIYANFSPIGNELKLYILKDGKFILEGTKYKNRYSSNKSYSKLPDVDDELFYTLFNEETRIKPIKGTPENIEAILDM